VEMQGSFVEICVRIPRALWRRCILKEPYISRVRICWAFLRGYVALLWRGFIVRGDLCSHVCRLCVWMCAGVCVRECVCVSVCICICICIALSFAVGLSC